MQTIIPLRVGDLSVMIDNKIRTCIPLQAHCQCLWLTFQQESTDHVSSG